jgi:cobalt/nickel transport system permease protein
VAANTPIATRSAARAKRRPAACRGFFERSIGQFMEGLERANCAESASTASGLLQQLSPQTKLLSILLLVCGVAGAHSLLPIAAVLALAICIALASHIHLSFLVRFVWLGVLGLSGLIAIPALFLTPGSVIFRLPVLGWQVTEPGIHVTTLLLLRTETTATLLVLLVLSTPWMELLRSLRALGLPKVLVALVGMTYRYVFLLLELSLEMFESRRSRIVAPLRGADRRRLVAATAGVLLGKSAAMSEEVYDAMQARGYRGEVYLLGAAPARSYDWVALSLSVAGTASLIWR